MDPLSFLREECHSVASALNETLRHDYGPDQSGHYFQECRERLQAIRQAIDEDPSMDRASIAAHMGELSALGSRISLIERSHLGEFSWPFAGVIRRIADTMFREPTIDGLKPPIVHVVAEGMDYQIVDDHVPNGGLRRIIIVAFPRQLKHHVLIHAIFGHELGHTAYNVEGTGQTIQNRVMPILKRGILSDPGTARAWLERDDAPAAIRSASASARKRAFDEQTLVNWRQEIVSDLFGLLLFGPAFAAAHRTVIEALCPRPDSFQLGNSTHPPYPVRQRILARAIVKLGWSKTISSPDAEDLYAAETALIGYLTQSVDDPWFDLLDDQQLEEALAAISQIFKSFPGTAYSPPGKRVLSELVRRLSLERPPIYQSLSKEGHPQNRVVPVAHCLYAGWTFWFGRDRLTEAARRTDREVREPSFLEINRLCNQAILQQEAIDFVIESGTCA
ncbi:hypothetical protein [Sphingomonas sp. CFBP 8765]|uniref:hypothetical protein n=1 Tax=Sphingomonas sp. CFBP 8765 TaxID=2775274 RepID=UPI00177D8020|nr:hypothetical protein [Sphingomonas sp. CFBP 8765]MBD8471556.1 hypothetical protein [Sphingomonas sp. CFBP 8765]